jgi:hypothetical protein
MDTPLPCWNGGKKCERGEHAALKHYEEALAGELAAETNPFVKG